MVELVGDKEVEHEIEEADTFSGIEHRALIDATCVIEERISPSSIETHISVATLIA